MPRSTLPCPLGGHLSHRQLVELRAMLVEQREFRLEQLSQLREPALHGPLGSTDPEIVSRYVLGRFDEDPRELIESAADAVERRVSLD